MTELTFAEIPERDGLSLKSSKRSPSRATWAFLLKKNLHYLIKVNCLRS